MLPQRGSARKGVPAMFVKRDASGVIVAVSQERAEGFSGPMDAADPELRLFLDNVGVSPVDSLRQSDLEAVRVLEDLIDVLIAKGVVRFTDLPEPAQKKLLQRKSLRQNSSELTLLGEDDGLI
jgi:hypothetical protein